MFNCILRKNIKLYAAVSNFVKIGQIISEVLPIKFQIVLTLKFHTIVTADIEKECHSSKRNSKHELYAVYRNC